ncbi:hypothetical protein OQJ19_05350 [Fluoribacter gormanii]|uniref:Uncharacterized protein n=1 Tax=Fluoribacter gormanii TaxID=464 RepID=A0A377GFG6_9GAMM|nr:hypothetical protein [Fluoribacter gormanii]KTD01591.1 hypothetical protein Lgor_2248 [Fluoribacter gormanii]MCW8444874.1 hypothetical protein [Fluoribacter gormanii]MCW8470084.1 hypothetical protein [Fluoribacter gormanii]SIR66753.1 hypothetical protein SAMN05421777_11891 [Fluoribacter gormanii]STO23559.1 Uncharacterised protein [Fluoribacter gormanii]
MNDKFSPGKIFENLVPFLIAGVAIALFFGLLFMFSYVLIWGLIIGGILWIIATIKQYLFPSSPDKTEITAKSQGRIIEHDDEK